MLLWSEDLMNVTVKLQFIDPTFRHSCLVPSYSRPPNKGAVVVTPISGNTFRLAPPNCMVS